MRRFGRILAYAATALSLALCVTVVALWARSYVTPDAFARTEAWVVQTDAGPRNHVCFRWVVSDRGRVRRSRTDGYIEYDGPTYRAPWHRSDEISPAPDGPQTFWARIGLFVRYTEESPPKARWFVREAGTPYWLPALVAASLRLYFARRTRRLLRAIREGLCGTCGYDLRATPDRCPECGAVPAATNSAGTAPPGGSRP